MKIYLIILLAALSANKASCQKQRLEGDTSPFLCKGDSISATTTARLRTNNIDTIVLITHDYDNGRLESGYHVIIWTQNGKTFARVITGCDSITKDTLYHTDISQIIRYFTSTQLPPEDSQVENDSFQSHDTAYAIEIRTPLKGYSFQVRDNALTETKEHILGGFDPRIVLTKMLKKIIQ